MKIGGPHKPYGVEPVRQADRARPTSKTKGGKNVGERVQVSEEAQLLAAARGPEQPDEAKIAELRDAIREGRFSIDAERIAKTMLDEEV